MIDYLHIDTIIVCVVFSLILNAVAPLGRWFNARSKVSQQSIIILIALVAAAVSGIFDCYWIYEGVSCPFRGPREWFIIFATAYVVTVTFNLGSGELIQAAGDKTAKALTRHEKEDDSPPPDHRPPEA